MKNATWLQIERRLEEAGLYLTPYHRAVIEEVSGANGPIGPAELRKALPEQPHRSTLYRVLDRLTAAGVLRRVTFAQETTDRFELGEGLAPHHHHAVCEKCGDVQRVDGCTVSNLPLKTPRSFTVLRHQLELYGLCKRCAS